ncbi:hypothetical protein EDB85DRAFT_1887409 [Lactarius pseudohatsudake]|nr:hypothetical protein EDB85DRAFT_1887409 [Lactarius pseudohatsudake]
MAPSTRRSRLIAAKITAALSHTNGAPSENVLDSQSPDHTSTSTQRAAVNQNNPDLSGTRTMIPLPPRLQPLFQLKSSKGYLQSERESLNKGPVGVRPMPLQLPSEGETMASSFYPGRGDMTHPLASLQVNSGNQFAHDSDPNDDDIENEDDWLEDEQVVNVARKVSAKTAEVTITERPSWLVDVTPPGAMQIPGRNVLDVDMSGSATGHGSASSTPRPRLQSEPGAPTVELLATATTLQTEATTESSGVTWPTDTELLPPGASKLMLTHQNPLVRTVVQESIENLRASLMFSHAFPDGSVALTFIKEGLINAAEKLKPGAADIQRRLEQDDDYVTKISQLVSVVMVLVEVAVMAHGPLSHTLYAWGWVGMVACRRPRARIPLIRSDVKDCCSAFCVPALVLIGSANDIAQVKFLVGVPKRTHPYRNECIIEVIRELFFTGGKKSFSSHFNHLFPVYQGLDGTSSCEVPAPMVALVATAMYATLNEWRTGKSQVLEFSANTYLDVYRCNVMSLNYILNHRPNAYHVMMADIYSQASSSSKFEDSPGVAIVELDLDDLEG